VAQWTDQLATNDWKHASRTANSDRPMCFPTRNNSICREVLQSLMKYVILNEKVNSKTCWPCFCTQRGIGMYESESEFTFAWRIIS
jgi:hypothetical protein